MRGVHGAQRELPRLARRLEVKRKDGLVEHALLDRCDEGRLEAVNRNFLEGHAADSVEAADEEREAEARGVGDEARRDGRHGQATPRHTIHTDVAADGPARVVNVKRPAVRDICAARCLVEALV